MPNPNPKAYTKRLIGTVIVVSIVLIAVIIAAIWQATGAMLGISSRTVTTENGSSASGYPGAMPPMAVDVNYGGGTTISKGGVPIMPTQQPGATPEDRAAVGVKIIRNGSLTLRVDDAAKRLEELRTIVSNAKGFVDSANVTDNAGVKTAYVSVRVPNEQFDAVRLAAKALASTVFVETENSQDVTAQFVDLDARLTAAKAEEQSYLEILKKSGSIQDVLAVTQQLAQVRSTIEQLQGQLRYMNDQTTYATLTITLTEEAKVVVPTTVWKPLETFNVAVRALVQSMQYLADALITAGVFILGLVVPIVIVCWLIGWIVWRIIRAITKR